MDKILIIEGSLIKTNLPDGKTQSEILEMVKKEITQEVEENLRYENVKIYGKIPSGLSCWLGYRLSSVCHSVSMFDPKKGEYFIVFDGYRYRSVEK